MSKTRKRMWVLAVSMIILAAAAGLWVWPRFAGTTGVMAIEQPRDAPFFAPSPDSWQSFLALVVDDAGDVDYEAGLRRRQRLNTYLDQVARATPALFETDAARLAFYINAYNALVIHGVLRYWPIEAVEEAGPLHFFFREKAYTLAGTVVSLHGFESKIIRRYDPRMHFALNCASASCPRLRVEAFTAERLEDQLEEATRDFLNNPNKNYYNPHTKTWHLSKIFDWYADDFGGRAGVITFLRRYTTHGWHDGDRIEYLPYDWSLNRSRGV